MIRWFLVDLRRAVVSVPFLVGIVIAVAAIGAGMMPHFPAGHWAGAFYVFFSTHLVVPLFVAPVVATIPFAQSYAIERNSGFSKSVLVRMPTRRYQVSRVVSNALAGGLVLALPLAATVLLLTAMFPFIPDENYIPALFVDGSVPVPNQLVHMWLYVGLAFMFGATFATIGLASSVLLRNPYYAIGAAAVVFFIPTIFGSLLGPLAYLRPVVMWDPSFDAPLQVGINYAVFWTVSLLVFVRFFRHREE